MPLPTPRLAPVTSAILPSSLIGQSLGTQEGAPQLARASPPAPHAGPTGSPGRFQRQQEQIVELTEDGYEVGDQVDQARGVDPRTAAITFAYQGVRGARDARCRTRVVFVVQRRDAGLPTVHRRGVRVEPVTTTPL